MKAFFLFFISLFISSLSLFAANPEELNLDFGDPVIRYEKLDHIPSQYLQLQTQEVILPLPKPTPTKPGSGSSGDIVIDKIIMIGKAAWDFIKENRPIVEIGKNVAHVVPEGISEWNELDSWAYPENHSYNVTYKNLYGVNVVNLTFQVLYTPNGSYEGKGAYLANITVLPAEMTAAWGYTVKAATNVHRPLNVGTKENPIANVLMDVTWSVETPVRKSIQSLGFSISGDGHFQRIQ